ncbi:uncharacterized protein LOC144286226 isoform X2 [Canis aureus]
MFRLPSEERPDVRGCLRPALACPAGSRAPVVWRLTPTLVPLRAGPLGSELEEPRRRGPQRVFGRAGRSENVRAFVVALLEPNPSLTALWPCVREPKKSNIKVLADLETGFHVTKVCWFSTSLAFLYSPCFSLLHSSATSLKRTPALPVAENTSN